MSGLEELRARRERLRRELTGLDRQIQAVERGLVDEIRGEWTTPRQREVLELVRAGNSNKEIGWVLHICESAVKCHVSELLRRAGVSSRLQL